MAANPTYGTRQSAPCPGARTEQLLQILLDKSEIKDNRASCEVSELPEALRCNLSDMLEELLTEGLISAAFNNGSRCEAFLTEQGKTYFSDRRSAPPQAKIQKDTAIPLRRPFDVFIAHLTVPNNELVANIAETPTPFDIQMLTLDAIHANADEHRRNILQSIARAELTLLILPEKLPAEWQATELEALLQRRNSRGQLLILPLIPAAFSAEIDLPHAIKFDSRTPMDIATLAARELIRRYR